MLKFSETLKAKPIRKDAVLTALEKSVARSAWAKGVRNYACDLISDFDADTNFSRVTEKDLLNGADDWKQYSWGGNAYIYDRDICEILCTPTEKKHTKNGELPPNSREEWLDVQARALFQASCLESVGKVQK